MELFDDWGSTKRIPPKPRPKERMSPQPASAKAIRDKLAKLANLADFKPHIINVHCYEDVGYPWVQVVFKGLIDPDVALRVGDALAEVAGEDCVYLNSLRPRAVYFVLEPAFDPKPDLEASRYGASLAEVRKSWKPT